jgi:nucleoside-diphosphate-sugar epimerase
LIASVADLRYSCNVLNVGSGQSYSGAEVIGIIQPLKQARLPVESSEERRRDEVMDTVADISKIKSVLNWEPKWTLIEGIKAILSDERK